MDIDIQNYKNGLCCVAPIPPTVNYPVAPGGKFTFTEGTSVNLCPTTLSGDTPITLSISPSLPAGLSFNTSTGCITGTPTETSATTNHTVTATNSVGSDNDTFDIIVNAASVPVAPTISYPSTTLNLISGNPFSMCPDVLTGDLPITVSVNPSLPSGLTLDSSTGCITGTPTANTTLTSFTFTATNSVGTDDFVIDIDTTLLPIIITNNANITDQATGDAYMTLALTSGSLLASNWDAGTNTYTCNVTLGSTVGTTYFDGDINSLLPLGNMPFNANGFYSDLSGLITNYTGGRHFASQDGTTIEIGGSVTFGDVAFRGSTNCNISLNNFNAIKSAGQNSARFADNADLCTFNFKGNIGLTQGEDEIWDSGSLPVGNCTINALISHQTSNTGNTVEGDLDVLITNGLTVNFTL